MRGSTLGDMVDMVRFPLRSLDNRPRSYTSNGHLGMWQQSPVVVLVTLVAAATDVFIAQGATRANWYRPRGESRTGDGICQCAPPPFPAWATFRQHRRHDRVCWLLRSFARPRKLPSASASDISATRATNRPVDDRQHDGITPSGY